MTQISAYEEKVWSALVAGERARRSRPASRVVTRVSHAVGIAVARVRENEVADSVFELSGETLGKALEGAFHAVFIPAIRTASIDRAERRVLKSFPQADPESPFLSIDLKHLDRHRPGTVTPFVGAAESGAASVVVSGLTVSATVSGGTTALVALGAIAADAIASIALLGRTIAEIAANYGYDPRLPEEELYLLGVLNYSMAATSGSRTAALASVSRLSQQMMRNPTWAQLSTDPIVIIIQRIFATLGLKLTHTKLATAVPIAGVVISSGLSFQALKSAADDATRLYRARYLAEKHNLSWDAMFDASQARATDDESSIDPSSAAVDDLFNQVVDGVVEGDVPAGRAS
ncbi:EcsC family protein [Agrococcus sp. ProA11]|uniref:EcsC family protein n=1 Tax=Agrococcus chionoecetis TaxID=3153752 RepID=UPI003261557C